MFDSPLPFGPPARILVVGSAEDVAGAITVLLEDAGFRAVTAGDAPTALRFAAADPFDLWLVDTADETLDSPRLVDALRSDRGSMSPRCLGLVPGSTDVSKPAWADGVICLPIDRERLTDLVIQALWLPQLFRGRRRGCRPLKSRSRTPSVGNRLTDA
jgi:CheY-like chemotaxis protein